MNNLINTTKGKYIHLSFTVQNWKLKEEPYLASQKEEQDENQQKQVMQQRIKNTNSRLLFLQSIIVMADMPDKMYKEFQSLLSSLQFLNKTADKQLIHAAVDAVNIRLHRMNSDTEIFTSEQREHIGKVINWTTDAIKLIIDGGMFIDWSNLQK